MTKNPNLAQVFHYDLQGKREFKYDFLNQNSLDTIAWNELQPEAPNFFLVKKNFDQSGMYEMGFKVDELFKLNASGITTERDNITIHFEELTLKSVLNDFKTREPEEIRKKYQEKPDGRDWKIITAKQDILRQIGKISNITYRPFDVRKTFFTGKSKGFMSYPRNEVMKHLFQPNLALIIPKQAIKGFRHTFISKTICDKNLIDSAGQFGAGNVFPLYLYPEESKDLFAKTERTPNLNKEIVAKIAEGLGIKFTPEKTHHSSLITHHSFAPIDILDYIYAVLYSPTYREKYKEFLKIDFPRVPYPTNEKTFWQLVALGAEIRQIHLLESPAVEKYITQYPINGDNVVVKPKYENSPPSEGCAQGGVVGKVYINDTQYFDNVPQIAWEFFIGGYQPAQKWLKDRKDRKLEFDDIFHYQKIIVALTQTENIMTKINGIDIEVEKPV